MDDLSRLIDESIREAGLSVPQVARAIEISENAIYKLRAGHSQPSASTLLRLASLLPGFHRRLNVVVEHGRARHAA